MRAELLKIILARDSRRRWSEFFFLVIRIRDSGALATTTNAEALEYFR